MLSTLEPAVEGEVGEQTFREALGLFASGVTIISTLDSAGNPQGMTATAFSSLSLDPPLVMVAVACGARCHELITAERRFGVSILGSHQTDLSRHFGGTPMRGVDPRFTRINGLPVLDEALVTLTCELNHTFEGGDHTIFVGLVTSTRSTGHEPLIHFGGRYRVLAGQRSDRDR